MTLGHWPLKTVAAERRPPFPDGLTDFERVTADACSGNGALSCQKHVAHDERWVGRGKRAAAKIAVGLTDQTLSCTARAHVPKPERHAARRT